ncbi:YncE family protein [Candidatus Uabimicrobium sp. HlEnr_7]|uniref:YncE family protein n=1 Tax=Candidatus Uabimicrobium helgolandensis TaxID=3095367 RepID=UPI00355742E0
MRAFLFLFLSVVIYAGTPHVAELKLQQDPTIVFTQGFEIEVVIETIGKNQRAVIATEWSIKPELPQGLELRQGKKGERYKLFISGTVKKVQALREYTVKAMNNGNKVKKIDAAVLKIRIKIQPPKSLLVKKDFDYYILNMNNLKYPIRLNKFSSLTTAAYGDGFLALVTVDGYIHFLNAVTYKKISSVKLPAIAMFDIFFYKGRFHLYYMSSNELISVDPHLGEFVIKRLPLLIFEPDSVYHFQNYLIFTAKSIDEHFRPFVVNLDDLEKIYKYDLSIEHLAVANNSFAFLDKKKNALVICHIKNGELKTKDISMEPFKIKSTSIVYGDNHFIFSCYYELLNGNYINKVSVDEGHKKNSILFGNERPTKLCYGGGCIVAASQNKIRIFHAASTERMFEQEIPQIGRINFINDHFVISTLENQNFVIDTKNIEKKVQDFPYFVGSFKINALRSANINAQRYFYIRDGNTIRIIDANNMSQVVKTKGYDCLLFGKNSIASIDGDVCRIVDVESKKEIDQIPVAGISDTIRRFGEKLFIAYDSEIAIIDSKKNQKLMSFSDEIRDFEIAQGRMIVATANQIQIIDLETEEIVQSFGFGLGRSDNQRKIIVDGDCFWTLVGNEVWVVDIKSGNILLQKKGPYDTLKKTTENLYVVEYIDNITFISFSDGKFEFFEVEENLEHTIKLIYGDLYVMVLTKDKICWLNVITKKVDSYTYFANTKNGIFIDGKFIVQDEEGRFQIIQSKDKKVIGNMHSLTDFEAFFGEVK